MASLILLWTCRYRRNFLGCLREGWKNAVQDTIYFALVVSGLLEWDKLAQNPALAFYQNWPWLCP